MAFSSLNRKEVTSIWQQEGSYCSLVLLSLIHLTAIHSFVIHSMFIMQSCNLKSLNALPFTIANPSSEHFPKPKTGYAYPGV